MQSLFIGAKLHFSLFQFMLSWAKFSGSALSTQGNSLPLWVEGRLGDSSVKVVQGRDANPHAADSVSAKSERASFGLEIYLSLLCASVRLTASALIAPGAQSCACF